MGGRTGLIPCQCQRFQQLVFRQPTSVQARTAHFFPRWSHRSQARFNPTQWTLGLWRNQPMSHLPCMSSDHQNMRRTARPVPIRPSSKPLTRPVRAGRARGRVAANPANQKRTRYRLTNGGDNAAAIAHHRQISPITRRRAVRSSNGRPARSGSKSHIASPASRELQRGFSETSVMLQQLFRQHSETVGCDRPRDSATVTSRWRHLCQTVIWFCQMSLRLPKPSNYNFISSGKGVLHVTHEASHVTNQADYYNYESHCSRLPK